MSNKEKFEKFEGYWSLTIWCQCCNRKILITAETEEDCYWSANQNNWEKDCEWICPRCNMNNDDTILNEYDVTGSGDQ